MTAEATIRLLQAGARTADAAEWRRKAARVAWVKETVAALRKAHRTMDDRCMKAVDRMSEEEFNRLFEEEQAKVDAIRARLDAVIERDEWPRDLYFSGV